LSIEKWGFPYKKQKQKIFSFVKAITNWIQTYTGGSQKLREPFIAHCANSNTVLHLTNGCPTYSGILIIDFVRWLCGPWVAFGHWHTYLTLHTNLQREDCWSCISSGRLRLQCRRKHKKSSWGLGEEEDCWSYYYLNWWVLDHGFL
jgi:hypothetical protein